MFIQIRRTTLSILFFALALALSMSVKAQDFAFIGMAVHPDSGALLYNERHDIKVDDDGEYVRSSVRYVSADGELIAQKELDFSDNQFKPVLNFAYWSRPLAYQTEFQEQALVLTTVDGNDAAVDTIGLDADLPIVVDSGFDRMLLQHWDEVVSGNEKNFEFLALTRGSTVEFVLRVVEHDPEMVRFSIAPASWLIGLLMDPIYLDYDTKTKRLRRYEGLTNIAMPGSEDNYVAIIKYQYSDEEVSLVELPLVLSPASDTPSS